MALRTFAAMSPCPSPCGFTQFHGPVRAVAFIAAEQIPNAGIWMVQEEKLDGWEDEYWYQEYVAPLG